MLQIILSTDSFPQEVVKINAAINLLNNVAASNSFTTVFTLVNPLNNQDILVYNSTSNTFTNLGIAALVNQILIQNKALNTAVNKPYYYSQLRTVI